MDKEKLKELLEKTAQESGLKIKGEIVETKSPEQLKAEEEFENWKKEDSNYEILKEFYVPSELLNCLLATSDYEGMILSGEGGIGKTILTISTIKKTLKADEWNYQNGYTTPLSLYEFLYNNRNKKVIILDDIEGVFNNKISLAILKGCLWASDGQRICQYASKSDKANVPEKFIMKSKVIILCNYIPKIDDSSTRALISRTIYHKLNFTFDEKMNICKDFVYKNKTISDNQKKNVMDILEKGVSEATRDFNFRTLSRLIAFVKYDKDKASDLFKQTTEVDELKQIYLEVIKKHSEVKHQIPLFIEMSGRSRRTYFRVKKEISVKVSSNNDMTPDTKSIGDNQIKNDCKGVVKNGK